MNKVKTAWQNPETLLFEIKDWATDKITHSLNEKDLQTLIELMPGYKWIIVEWNQPKQLQ